MLKHNCEHYVGTACPMCAKEDSELIAKLQSQLRVAVEALKFYAEWMSYSMDWDTSDRGVSRRVILYSDQEEINEATIIAGKRAREALQKIEAMKGGGDE